MVAKSHLDECTKDVRDAIKEAMKLAKANEKKSK